MDEILRRTLLFDFYGELLTKHQQEIYEQVVLNDVGCSELAQQANVSRQSIHELVRKCDRILEDYEARLHLVERFKKVEENVREIRGELSDAEKEGRSTDTEKIRRITDLIIKEL